jgi:hypothetical protein
MWRFCLPGYASVTVTCGNVANGSQIRTEVWQVQSHWADAWRCNFQIEFPKFYRYFNVVKSLLSLLEMLLDASVLPAAPAPKFFSVKPGKHIRANSRETFRWTWFYPKKPPVDLINSQNFHVSDEMHVWESKKNITSILFVYGEGNPITGMRRITTFRSTTDRIYDGGPTRLYYTVI